MAYTNSSLVSYTKLSPNHSGQRTHSIDRITPHCVVGQLSCESICGCFTSPSRQASCNYGIGKDGQISLCVEEKNRSWCSSSAANDQRAITIECASDMSEPYAMNTAVYESLVKLCTDVCKRNGKKKLLWLGDKNTTLNYKLKTDEMVLTVHRWFANKSCPGNWLYARLGDLATRVTANLGGSQQTTPSPTSISARVLVRTMPSGTSSLGLGCSQSLRKRPVLVLPSGDFLSPMRTSVTAGFPSITQSSCKVLPGGMSCRASFFTHKNSPKNSTAIA